jgi:hypothetical protein
VSGARSYCPRADEQRTVVAREMLARVRRCVPSSRLHGRDVPAYWILAIILWPLALR